MSVARTVHKTGTVYNNPVADIFRRSETIARYSDHQTRWARGTQPDGLSQKASMANAITDRRYDKYAADPCIELARDPYRPRH